MDPGVATRWDLYEEHLDEAAFLSTLWEAALRSPEYTLPEIAQGPEERLLAHLDGLVLGGAKVARRLLLPALGGDDAGVVFAAAFALLEGRRAKDFEAVIAALGAAEPAPRAALRRALAVAPRPDLAQRLAPLALKLPALQSDLLEVLGALRLDPGLRLEPLAAAADAATAVRALRVARVFPERLDRVVLERAFHSTSGAVRGAALEAGAIAGLRLALDAAAETVRARAPGFATAALLLALSGEEKWVPPLAAALGDEQHATAAAFALGFTGRASACEALLPALRAKKLARVAGEAFAAITGLSLANGFAQAPKRWTPGAAKDGAAGGGPQEDGAEEEDERGPQADLPLPAAAEVARFWQAERERLPPAGRFLRGRPWTAQAVLGELAGGPARRRPALATWLAINTRGKVQLAWDALSARQFDELREARGGVQQ